MFRSAIGPTLLYAFSRVLMGVGLLALLVAVVMAKAGGVAAEDSVPVALFGALAVGIGTVLEVVRPQDPV